MRQLDILNDSFVLVPLRLDGVGGGEDGRARIQGADDSRLGDGQRLLLHHFVQDGASALVHLVKLVNAANSVIAQHQSSTARKRVYFSYFLVTYGNISCLPLCETDQHFQKR